ncbi:MAG TPA: DUF3017 domain-containing protein [Kineosporiaceae bacterium]|nr:DUF3017 domain-containing protein [Kineosporiaceae bacterium]
MVRWEVPPNRRLAFTAVLLTVAASVVVTVLVDFRTGGYVLAGACVLAASFRAALPEQYCLGLLVRSRRIDVTTALVLAVAVGLVAGIVPPGPSGS